jgi:alpha-D-xyloside xylohydrolase
VALGVSGYKLDECDNSDFTGSWSFPELSKFPSGADGEQMHSMFGQHYADAIQIPFDRRKTRTYGLIRSAGALAAPYPYALYSDLYDHAEFVKGVAKIGFCGLLWTPEVRDAETDVELIRRLQSVVLSPLALINAWYIKNPPWMQIHAEANNAGQLDPNWERLEAQCRTIMELRMKLVPYLHAAFVRYHREGVPPFRALVMDSPGDSRTWAVDDEFLVGESLLVAPVVGNALEREVYLPEGEWYDYWSGQRYDGKQSIKVSAPLEQIPIFVKSGTLLPLAQPTLHTADPASYRLTAQVYGAGSVSALVYEDEGSAPASLKEVRLSWDASGKSGSVHRDGPSSTPQYEVIDWKTIA